MDSADFAINLIDKATGPGKRIAGTFDNIGKAAKQVGGHGSAMGSMEGGLAGGVAVGTIFAGVLMKVGEAALAAVMAVVKLGAQATLALASAVGSAALLREKMTSAFGALLHGDGLKAFERVKQLALEFGTPLDEATQQFKKLFAMQFAPAMAEDLFKRMQDLKAVGASTEEVGRAMTAITQIKATGKLQGDELLQLAEAGVSVDLVYQELQKTLGKSRAEILKMQAAGKISADVAIAAIQAAIGKKTGAAKAGDAAKKFMDSTLNGMLERIKNFGGIFFDDIAKELGPMVVALKPILDDIFAGLRGPEVKAVIMGIANGFKAVLGFVVAAWPSVKAFINGMVTGFKSATSSETFVQSFKILKSVLGEINWTEFAAGAAKVGQIVGFLLATLIGLAAVLASVGIAVGKVVVWFTTLPETITTAAMELGASAGTIGSAIINGIVNGITGGVSSVVNAIKNVANSAISTAKSTLGIASPSKVFENFGFLSAEGFAQGMTGGAASVRSASSEMTGSATSFGGAALAGGGGMGDVSLTIQMMGGGAAQNDPARLADEIGVRVRRELSALLDGM